MRYRLPNVDMTALATGSPLGTVQASYFEVVDLADLEATLRQLGLSLVAAGVITTLAGAALGSWASRRALSPLADVSDAARAIAGGRLDTRLDALDDPDLDSLVSSFNQMVAALQERIERDARFASDVSHELRSPLQTLAAAVQVLERRRDELSDRAQAAVGLLSVEVDRFQELVDDLLEISRFDAGAQQLELDDVRLDQVVMEAVRASGSPQVPVEVEAGLAGAVVPADKRRLMRVIANLLENAEKYAGGATTVTLTTGDDGRIVIAVADDGPGIPEQQRAVIFDRFARGSTAGRRGSSDGVGLGLALVEEHVRLHGGRVWVEEGGRRRTAPGSWSSSRCWPATSDEPVDVRDALAAAAAVLAFVAGWAVGCGLPTDDDPRPIASTTYPRRCSSRPRPPRPESVGNLRASTCGGSTTTTGSPAGPATSPTSSRARPSPPCSPAWSRPDGR